MKIQPFTIEIPQVDLDDLQQRLQQTRWPDELPDAGTDYGVPLDQIKNMVDYWLSDYDWRQVEAELNAYPQFLTEIEGQQIHFLHVRSPEADTLPLILTHGWPGSFVEFLDVIGPLSDPRAYGGDPTDAFHLVIPSLPGFTFSGPTRERGWNRYRTARAWAALMSRLGYTKYGAAGNDAGSFVAPEIGRCAGEHVVGVHVTQLFSFPSGDPAEMAGLSEKEMAALEQLQWFWETMSAFNQLQSTQPQTLAYALLDSPTGQLAWNAQLFAGLDEAFIVTNVMLYWLTRTAGSAARFYYEDAHAEHPSEPTTTATGLAMFAGDFQSIRRFAERDHKNIVHWSEYDRGGHYAAHSAPDLYTDDLRTFFRNLRRGN